MAYALLFLCACGLLLPAGHGTYTGAGEGLTRKGGFTSELGGDSHPAHRAGEEGASAGRLVARRGLAPRKAVAGSGSLPVKGAMHPSDAAALLTVAARWRDRVEGAGAVDNLKLLATWNVTRPCSRWYGVTCNSATGRVTGIKLPSILRSEIFVFLLGGPLPAEFGSLPELRSLILARQALTGPYPKQWARLRKLSHLDLSDVGLSMGIRNAVPLPREVCNLTSLTYLNFRNIGVTLPKDFLQLSRLAYLYLDVAQMGFSSGALQAPDFQIIGNLPGLKYLFLSGALSNEGVDITGLSHLRGLKHLDLSNNGLGGVPSLLKSFTGLVALNLDGIRTGTFPSLEVPSWVGSLERLTSLSLGSNGITGSLPDWLWNLKALVKLNLGGNQLSGSIPGKLGALAHLATLDLSYNSLSGSIPEELGELTGLGALSLADNQLAGTLPASLLRLWAHRLSAEVQEGVYFPGLLSVHNNYLSGPCLSPSVASLKCPSSNKRCQRLTAQELSGLGMNCLHGCENRFGNAAALWGGSVCTKFCGADGPKGPCDGHGVCSLHGSQMIPKCSCSKGFVAPASEPARCLPLAS